MENFITRLFAELQEAWNVIIAKLNLLDTNKANKNLDNLPSNLTSTEKTTIRTKIGAIDSAALDAYIPKTEKGSANGVATLDGTGRVPAVQLPSFVDDVVDLVDFVATAPTTGMVAGQKRYITGTKKIFTSTSATSGTVSDPEADKIYVRISNNTTYRWSGSDMIQLDSGLALGETSSTAYRGDRGKIAYDHSIAMGDANVAIPDWSTQLENQVNF